LLTGAGDAAGGAVLESVNDVGPLRPGATALLESVVAGRPLAVAAIQPYGRGKSVGIATNTLWRLARAGGDGTTAYGRFWRQLVRHAADAGDASHLARVQWDRERYQPGDEAVATITVLAPPGAAPRLAATLATATGGATSETPVPLEAAAGQAGSLRARVRFGERGEYRFHLTIGQPGQADDTYEKIFAIAPRLGEGNRLAVDAAMLSAAAGAAGGIYAGEKDLEPLLAHLRTTLLGKPVTSDLALVGGDPWYLLLFLALLIGEWWLRRRKHLL
nr:hypothetical protein [Planctomycetota bacterium]